MKRLLALTLFTVLAAGCSKPMPDTRAADAQAIQAAFDRLHEAFETHDFDAATKIYSSDAVLFAPGAPVIEGREGIKAALQGAFSDPGTTISLTPTKIEVARAGDIAYAYGTSNTTMTDKDTGQKMEEKGKWVVVFKKQPDGSWQAVADIFNSDGPPAAAE
jgi:uncharacterized protein (TIGR02246 family)